MQNPIPRGPDHLYCPHWRKKMAAVCHTCPLWTEISGTNPQTGEVVRNWNCALAHMPMLVIETSRAARSGAAATENFRNEVIKRAPPSQQPNPKLAHAGTEKALTVQ